MNLLKAFTYGAAWTAIIAFLIVLFGRGSNQHLTEAFLKDRLAKGMSAKQVKAALNVDEFVMTRNEPPDIVHATLSDIGICFVFWPQHSVVLTFRDGKLDAVDVNYTFGMDESLVSLLRTES